MEVSRSPSPRERPLLELSGSSLKSSILRTCLYLSQLIAHSMLYALSLGHVSKKKKKGKTAVCEHRSCLRWECKLGLTRG